MCQGPKYLDACSTVPAARTSSSSPERNTESNPVSAVQKTAPLCMPAGATFGVTLYITAVSINRRYQLSQPWANRSIPSGPQLCRITGINLLDSTNRRQRQKAENRADGKVEHFSPFYLLVSADIFGSPLGLWLLSAPELVTTSTTSPSSLRIVVTYL